MFYLITPEQLCEIERNLKSLNLSCLSFDAHKVNKSLLILKDVREKPYAPAGEGDACGPRLKDLPGESFTIEEPEEEPIHLPDIFQEEGK